MKLSPIDPKDSQRQSAALLVFTFATAAAIIASYILIGCLVYLTNHGH
jgi:hypothetical protein